jgi:hypothetical protein
VPIFFFNVMITLTTRSFNGSYDASRYTIGHGRTYATSTARFLSHIGASALPSTCASGWPTPRLHQRTHNAPTTTRSFIQATRKPCLAAVGHLSLIFVMTSRMLAPLSQGPLASMTEAITRTAGPEGPEGNRGPVIQCTNCLRKYHNCCSGKELALSYRYIVPIFTPISH